jgi:hypothetical protein
MGNLLTDLLELSRVGRIVNPITAGPIRPTLLQVPALKVRFAGQYRGVGLDFEQALERQDGAFKIPLRTENHT